MKEFVEAIKYNFQPANCMKKREKFFASCFYYLFNISFLFHPRWKVVVTSQVTIFGQSAGAEAIGIHLTSQYSENLFQQAIMHSNPFGLPFRNLSDARKFGSIFAEKAGCVPDDMACLRSK